MIPPIVLNLSKREETAAAVAATTIDVMMTILEGVRFIFRFHALALFLRRMTK